jgi:hypothetical protein
MELAERRGKEVRLTHASELVRQVLQVSGLEKFLEAGSVGAPILPRRNEPIAQDVA